MLDFPILIKKIADFKTRILSEKRYAAALSIILSIALIYFGISLGGVASGFFSKKNILDGAIVQVREGRTPVGDEFENENPEMPQEQTPKVRRVIDGIFVNEGEENALPVAVMIENHTESRPPSGLSKASVVYEAEAEGGITRFLAVFTSTGNIPKIGPVRSARPYYIDLAEEYGALYVHCGGSPDALAKIIKERVFDLNEFYNAGIFWRSADRRAPHNVYTSSELINGFIGKKGMDHTGYNAWKFKDDAAYDKRGSTTEIIVPFKEPFYSVRWNYDADKNEYARWNGADPHNDDGGAQIAAKDVIVMYVNSKVVDDEGRRAIGVIGKGKALVCLDGSCAEGTWSRTSKNARTIFSDQDGNEFALNAGQIWVEVVPTWFKVDY